MTKDSAQATDKAQDTEGHEAGTAAENDDKTRPPTIRLHSNELSSRPFSPVPMIVGSHHAAIGRDRRL